MPRRRWAPTSRRQFTRKSAKAEITKSAKAAVPISSISAIGIVYGGYSNATRVVATPSIGIVYGGYGKRNEREMSAFAASSGISAARSPRPRLSLTRRPPVPIPTSPLEISGPPNSHFSKCPNDRQLGRPLRTIIIIFTLTISTCGCSTYAGNCAAYGTTARQVGGPARRPRRGSPSQKRQHPLGGAASGQSAFTYHRDPKVQTSGRQKEVVFLRGICFTCGK